MDADFFLQVFAASMAANVFTAMAILGFVLFARAEREAKEAGRKQKTPGYVYVLVLLPAAIGMASLYAVSL